VHQHKLPSENKAQLISRSLICLDENEFLITWLSEGLRRKMKWQGTHTTECCGGVCWLRAGRTSDCVFHRQQGGVPGCRRRKFPRGCRDWLPGHIAISSLHSQDNVPCDRPWTPSYVCIPACFATILQIISFTISQISLTLTGNYQLRETLFNMKPIFSFFSANILPLTEIWQRHQASVKIQFNSWYKSVETHSL